MTRAIRLTVALGVLAVGLLGCGVGGGGDSSQAAETLTRAQFIGRMTKYCLHNYTRQSKAVEGFAKQHGLDFAEPTQAERERIDTAVILGFVEKRIARLKSLPPPAGSEAEVGRIIEIMEEGVRKSRAHPDWLAAPTLQRRDPFTATRHLTKAFGIYSCS